MSESFPRQQARTRNFSLGVPRSFRISPDGRRVVFLRSQGGADPVTCLWVLDLPGAERLVADPAELGAAEAIEPATERARRERSREVAGGVVAFSTDATFSTAAFAGERTCSRPSRVEPPPSSSAGPTSTGSPWAALRACKG